MHPVQAYQYVNVYTFKVTREAPDSPATSSIVQKIKTPHPAFYQVRGLTTGILWQRSAAEILWQRPYAALDSSHLPSLYSRRNLATFFFDSSALVAFSG